jgi:1,4-dihydroxy-2-naphthoate octaprenyltransferase
VTAPGPIRRWVLGARPRTLAAAVVPVVVGTAVGWWSAKQLHGGTPGLLWGRAVLALTVALALQVGTNYANDYSDGIRGTDEVRVGPLRLVASGLVPAHTVRTASFAAFGVAGVAGLTLAALTTWWLVLVGVACIAAGWFYTGGPHPYGYIGLGEAFVFVFFGLVATAGSALVQQRGGFHLTAVSLAASVPVGLLAVALLEANNLRDVVGDTASGKRTLAVRLGRPRAGWLYVGALLGVAAGTIGLATWRPWVLLSFLALPLAVPPCRLVLGGAEGRELLPVLKATGRLQLVVGLLLTVGIVL